MACPCCTPTTEREPQRKAESVASERPDCGCGCGPGCGCGCGTRPADTERHLEEIRRRVTAVEPTRA